MTTYQVASSNFALGDMGATIEADQLTGCNVPALLAGGHLVVTNPPIATPAPPAIPTP